MLIEFVGFSSSGKTSLIEKIQEQYSSTMKIVELDYNNKPYTSSWESPFLLLSTDLKVLSKEMGTDLKILAPLFKNIFLQNTAILRKIALARSITRKYYLSKKYLKKREGNIYIFDEGMLQSCVNIAVTSKKFSDKLLIHTKSIIDSMSPDLVVYLAPPIEQLTNRISTRDDRKQWKGASAQTVVSSIELFDETINKLYTHKLLIINTPDVGRIINTIEKYTFNQGNNNA